MPQVKYWRNHEDTEGEAQRVVVPSRENHTRLEGMKANSNYLIEVQGYNSAGYGPPSEHLQIRTKKARMYCFEAIHPMCWLYSQDKHHFNIIFINCNFFVVYQLQVKHPG